MILEMLIGGGLTIAGFLLGRLLPTAPRRPKPIAPVCGCEHSLAYHDPKTGICHGTVEEPTRYSTYGEPRAFQTVQCTCRQYDGPTPLPTVYAPEVTG